MSLLPSSSLVQKQLILKDIKNICTIFNAKETDIGADSFQDKYSQFTIASFSVVNNNRSSQSGIDLKSIRCLAKRKIKLLRVFGYYWEFWDVGKVPKKHMKRLYVTQLLVRGKITRTPAGHVCLSFAEIQALLKRVVLKTGITGFKAK